MSNEEQRLRPVTYALGVSLDGYVTDPDGNLDWTPPDPEVFRFATDQVRELGVHLLGRRVYEAMLFWEDKDEDASIDPAWREFAAIWKAIPKVVFSRTLSTVQGNARLATGGLAEEIEVLRREPAVGDIAIAGATLAADAAALGLIDEYRTRLYPVILGGGIPYHLRGGPRTQLELVETRRFPSGVVYLRHRVVR